MASYSWGFDGADFGNYYGTLASLNGDGCFTIDVEFINTFSTVIFNVFDA